MSLYDHVAPINALIPCREKQTKTTMFISCLLIIQSSSDHPNPYPEERVPVITWHLDWTKKVLKIEEAEFSCHECQLLLNLSRLLNFFLMLDKSTDNTKLYSLASHFCQINGYSSQSGEDDFRLLQQAVSMTHSLHVLTKNMPDLTILGPNGKSVRLESVDEVVEYLLQALVPNSVQSSTSKVEQTKTKNTNLMAQANTTQQVYDTLTEVKLSSRKKKTKGMAQGCLANAHHTSNNEELEESGVFMDRSERPARKRLVLSEKRKNNSAGKVKLGKKRRSLPVMKLD
ncbi:uncharacterized protein LOC110050021 [Orbicella faveolata]|uniref:uncharacterized protein LOC110050021 n=1 Tax=Orbicella faveolata TaxID=48498 RepID=UPI0009E45DBA|nr:uncharacterized protein LOC110050021 [Orbicella faveolata]